MGCRWRGADATAGVVVLEAVGVVRGTLLHHRFFDGSRDFLQWLCSDRRLRRRRRRGRSRSACCKLQHGGGGLELRGSLGGGGVEPHGFRSERSLEHYGALGAVAGGRVADVVLGAAAVSGGAADGVCNPAARVAAAQ